MVVFEIVNPMRDGVYYQKLKNLVDSGRLSLTLVVAPPRTSSSLVEHIMGLSPDIAHECHEPFLESRKPGFDPDQGYKEIYEAIGGEVFEQSGETTSVVVKEMSHWIAANEEYKPLLELTKNPVLVLIRNPLLSVESRMQKVISTLDMRMNLNLQRCLLDIVAQRSGFKDWEDFSQSDSESDNVFLRRLRGNDAAARLYETPTLTTQNELLDYLAQEDGYANWRDLIKKKLYSERDLTYFDTILKSNSRRVGLEENEFTKLEEEVAYLESAGIEHYVFDTTDIRAMPDTFVQELCTKMRIGYSPQMLEWGMEPVNFHTSQVKQSERVWYDSLHASTAINPPSEVSPALDSFPQSVREYMVADNIPAYARLAKKKVLPEGMAAVLNEKITEIVITPENYASYKKLNIIDGFVEEGRVSVQLKYIDPVYAVTNQPELLEDAYFRERTAPYAEALTRMRGVIDGEPSREQRGGTSEYKFQ